MKEGKSIVYILNSQHFEDSSCDVFLGVSAVSSAVPSIQQLVQCMCVDIYEQPSDRIAVSMCVWGRPKCGSRENMQLVWCLEADLNAGMVGDETGSVGESEMSDQSMWIVV